jgi:hypothetical protein
LDSWLTEIAELEYIYVNYASHDRANARQLLQMWGREIDWDGYTQTVETIMDNDTKDDC